MRQRTLEEPDISRSVLKSGINFFRDPSPVPGRQRRISSLQFTFTNPPHVTRLEEKQLASDHRYCIKVCLTSIRLERR